VVRLYDQGVWEYADDTRTDGYSVVLFGPHGRPYRHPAPDALRAYHAVPDISSVQITFHKDRPQSAHVMPPGGFRLAIINSLDLETAFALRDTMAQGFGVERQARPHSRAVGTSLGDWFSANR